MLVVAAVSLFGSYFLFLAVRDEGGLGTVNNGAFVKPPLTVAELPLVADRERPIDWSAHWWLITVAAGECEQPCVDTVHLLRQMHILLNKDADRVRRGLVLTGTVRTDLRAEYPELALGRLPGLALTQQDRSLQPGVYIVDPIGNFVFRYPLEVDGSAMLKDLKRLLKVSQIG
jgi:cytochrome oxidase Cu insertion factor (SCO1/SenC/PrrC family)